MKPYSVAEGLQMKPAGLPASSDPTGSLQLAAAGGPNNASRAPRRTPVPLSSAHVYVWAASTTADEAEG